MGSVPALQEGAAQLTDGSSELVDGIEALNTGALALMVGANDIKDGTQTLRGGIESAKEATGDLKGAMAMSESLMAPIYDQLSASVTLMTNELMQAYGIVSAERDKAATASLAPIEQGLTGVLSGMDQLFGMMNGAGDTDVLMETLEQMTLEQIVRKNLDNLSVGIENVRDAQVSGVNILDETSRNNLSSAMGHIANADAVVASAGDSLNLLVVQMIDGEVLSGLKKLDSGMSTLHSGAKELNEGAEMFSASMPELIDGIDRLKAGGQALNEGLVQLEKKIPTLENGILTLENGTTTLSNNMNKVTDAGTSIQAGIETLNESMPNMVTGVAQLTAGSQTLSTGLAKLVDASGTMNTGIHTLYDQMPDLENGINTLYEGSAQLHDGLDAGIQTLSTEAQFSAKGIKTYAGEVVKLKDTDVYNVDNYGQSLSPYFDSLAMWVGALVMFVLMPYKRPGQETENPLQYVAGKYVTFLMISLIQAIALSTVIILIGLRPVSVIGFYAFNFLLSMCFVAILQMFNFLFGNVGKLLSMVLLVLQLTAANGTFPVALEPSFYRAIHAFMPFTYSISGLRDLISGVQGAIMRHDVMMLLLFSIGAFAITAFVYWMAGKKGTTKTVREVLNESV